MTPSPSPSPSPPESHPNRLLAALGNSLRWQIFRLLADGRALSATAVAKHFGRDFDGVSKHLRLMRRTGVLASRRGRDRRQELFHIPAARRATPGVIDYGFCAIRLEEARPDPDDSATDAPEPDPAPTVSAEGGAARYPRGFGEMIADPGGDI
ncbi:MAG: winged helix-turn-helix transcriptional regulator [Akkermansiaceae bacterium]|nr:winged helix-turn-helix transcriptional regulator [Akkermansiaceae bacterium]